MKNQIKNMARQASACLLGLAGVFAMVPAAQAQVTTELCLALDGSASMSNAQWDLQLEAYRVALQSGSPPTVPRDGTVQISIVLFASNAQVVSNSVVITSDAVANNLRTT